ncbi:NHL repeat-containing protein [Kitasatospora sp. NPDC057940]|uniref:NHL repeat-containing protein n=1 Tax=Kitasatospora sp. NPDC057940 TaxID=3346285 RepID=UPI0036DDDF5C
MANASTSGTGPQPVGLAQGVIATVVGGGNHVDIPADRLAAQVMLGHASRPAVDKDGNLYYPDQLRHWVCKVTPQGSVTTVAGTGAAGYTPDGGPAAAAKLNFPAGVAVDDAGNVYIADQLNHMVRKVSTAGVISRVDAPQIRVPADVAVDADGSLYIAEYGGHRISKVDAKGVVTTIAGNGQAGFAGDGGPATAARINSPIGVAVDGGGNVYIAEYAGHRVRKVDAGGVITTVAGTGTPGYVSDGGPATATPLNTPKGVAVDDAGNVYIADSANHRIRKVAPDGVITTVAGDGIAGYAGDGGPATAARLYSPGGVVLDRTGNLYIADTGNARIRGVTSAATTGSAWQDTPLRVTQTNVPRAFPDQPTVFNLEIHSLSNQPVNPGTIEQRFTAPPASPSPAAPPTATTTSGPPPPEPSTHDSKTTARPSSSCPTPTSTPGPRTGTC